jgi:hypothetical protein
VLKWIDDQSAAVGLLMVPSRVKNSLIFSLVKIPLPCADLTTFLTPRMLQPDDPEAQPEVEERQADDTGEKRRGINTKTQSSGMSAHRLTSPSPHLSSGELWRSF